MFERKKKHEYLSLLEKVRQPSELEVKFMLKFDQPGERKVANLPPKEPQTQLEPEGGRMTMIIMMMMMIIMMIMMTIMTMMNIVCFLHPKGPQTGLVPGGGQ